MIPESEGSDSPIYSEEFHDNNLINPDEHELPLMMSQENVESRKKDVDMHDQNQEKIVSKLIFTLVTVLEKNPHRVLFKDCKLILFVLKATQIIFKKNLKGIKKMKYIIKII